MNSSARNEFSNAEVIVDNTGVIEKRLEEARLIVDKQKKEIIELKAQVKVLKDVISENRGY